MKRSGKTPPFRDSRGIAETHFASFGGVAQWYLIRGENRENPPLILLHGGPGFSETHFFRHYCSPLEHAFTVVYWDQRGSGKSYSKQIPASSMTIDQFIADLDELVNAVRQHVGQKPVTIFGHSWGSVLGMCYAARFPEKVAAYVGSGQIGDWPAAETASYAYALAEAQRRDDRKAIEALREIGPPPYSADSLWTERTWLQQFEGQLTAKSLWAMLRKFVRTSELSILDIPPLLRGFRFSLDVMWETVSQINLHDVVPALAVPVFFLLGRNDRWVPPETSVAYLEALDAPHKQLIWFEQSGHEPFVDEPVKFNAAMIDIVRPVVVAAAGAEAID